MLREQIAGILRTTYYDAALWISTCVNEETSRCVTFWPTSATPTTQQSEKRMYSGVVWPFRRIAQLLLHTTCARPECAQIRANARLNNGVVTNDNHLRPHQRPATQRPTKQHPTKQHAATQRPAQQRPAGSAYRLTSGIGVQQQQGLQFARHTGCGRFGDGLVI